LALVDSFYGVLGFLLKKSFIVAFLPSWIKRLTLSLAPRT
jgi:hypothetical protein